MEDAKVRRVLSGSMSSNTCAFCAYHGRALTPNQLKSHKCLAKQCTALIKHEHPIWKQKEDAKKKRKARKKRLEEQYNAVRTERTSA